MEEQRTGTILDYARTQTRDFTEYPFQTADALVFALLSYDRICLLYTSPSPRD